MLFGGCNCIPGLSSLAASGAFGAVSMAFVTAMVGAMVAAAQTGQARPASPDHPSGGGIRLVFEA